MLIPGYPSFPNWPRGSLSATDETFSYPLQAFLILHFGFAISDKIDKISVDIVRNDNTKTFLCFSRLKPGVDLD